MTVQWLDGGYTDDSAMMPAGEVGGALSRGAGLSIPNLITLGRILLVPVVVWAIASGEMRMAFFCFLPPG